MSIVFFSELIIPVNKLIIFREYTLCHFMLPVCFFSLVEISVTLIIKVHQSCVENTTVFKQLFHGL